MDKLLDFIERHKFGIIITLILHVALFVYFQVATYQEPVIYDVWDFKGRNVDAPDDIQIDPDQIQTPQEKALIQPDEKVSSFVKNENDERDQSFDEKINYTSSDGDPAATAREYERSVKKEIMGERSTENKNTSNEKTGVETSSEASNEKNNSGGSNQTSSEAVAGQTMVSYRLEGRHPLNHNDWYVRNPGYTCGDINGTVKVLIEVAKSGEVVKAKVLDQQSRNATPCMLEKAEEYALKSRFNYASDADRKQQGIITYRFVFSE